MVYIIISIVIFAIAFGCLRSKISAGLIPVAILSFVLSAILSSGWYIYNYYQNQDKHRTETEVKDYFGEFEMDSGFLSKDYKAIIKDKNGDEHVIYDQKDSTKVIKDTVSFIRYTITEHVYSIDLPANISYTVIDSAELHLTEKDYGIYKAYLDSLAKRN